MLNLNKRQVQILEILVERNDFYTMVEISKDMKVSYRTINTDVQIIIDYLNELGISVIKKPYYGIKMDASSDVREKLLFDVKNARPSESLNYVKQRRRLLLLKLLVFSNRKFSIMNLAENFNISTSSIINDLSILEKEVSHLDLNFSMKRQNVYLYGMEISIRKALFILILEILKEENEEISSELNKAIYNTSNGMTTDFQSIISTLRELLFEFISNGDREMNELYFSDTILYTAIMILRISSERQFEKIEELYQAKNVMELFDFEQTNDICDVIEGKYHLLINSVERENFRRHFVSGGLSKLDIEIVEINTKSNNMASLTIYYTNVLIDNMSKLMGIDYRNQLYLYSSLRFHIKSMMSRINYDILISNPILEQFKETYPEEFLLTKMACYFTNERCDTVNTVPDEEIVYIMVYFQVALERKLDFINAVLVSRDSVGVSQLVKTRIENEFRDINIKEIVKPFNLNKTNFNSVDLVISTEKININLPYLEITALCDTKDFSKIGYQINQIMKPKTHFKDKEIVKVVEGKFDTSNLCGFKTLKDDRVYIKHSLENGVLQQNHEFLINYIDVCDIAPQLHSIFKKEPRIKGGESLLR